MQQVDLKVRCQRDFSVCNFPALPFERDGKMSYAINSCEHSFGCKECTECISYVRKYLDEHPNHMPHAVIE